MNVVSLVPSWTETLIASGVSVIGRTRFCIHPKTQTSTIPVVGGTKDWNWSTIENLKPDLILLDQEENPQFMSEQRSIPCHATHIQSVEDMPPTLLVLSSLLKNENLKVYSQRWSALPKTIRDHDHFANIPSLLDWGKKPTQPVKNIIYMIWKDPWMAVSRDTFIGSLLGKFNIHVGQFSEKYPKIALENYDPETTLILFSSEPYPFYKKKSELSQLPYPHAHVNGESWSWFGVRSLEFLEQNL